MGQNFVNMEYARRWCRRKIIGFWPWVLTHELIRGSFHCRSRVPSIHVVRDMLHVCRCRYLRWTSSLRLKHILLRRIFFSWTFRKQKMKSVRLACETLNNLHIQLSFIAFHVLLLASTKKSLAHSIQQVFNTSQVFKSSKTAGTTSSQRWSEVLNFQPFPQFAQRDPTLHAISIRSGILRPSRRSCFHNYFSLETCSREREWKGDRERKWYIYICSERETRRPVHSCFNN